MQRYGVMCAISRTCYVICKMAISCYALCKIKCLAIQNKLFKIIVIPSTDKLKLKKATQNIYKSSK